MWHPPLASIPFQSPRAEQHTVWHCILSSRTPSLPSADLSLNKHPYLAAQELPLDEHAHVLELAHAYCIPLQATGTSQSLKRLPSECESKVSPVETVPRELADASRTFVGALERAEQQANFPWTRGLLLHTPNLKSIAPILIRSGCNEMLQHSLLCAPFLQKVCHAAECDPSWIASDSNEVLFCPILDHDGNLCACEAKFDWLVADGGKYIFAAEFKHNANDSAVVKDVSSLFSACCSVIATTVALYIEHT